MSLLLSDCKIHLKQSLTAVGFCPANDVVAAIVVVVV